MTVVLRVAVKPRKGAAIALPGQTISLPSQVEAALISAGKATKAGKRRGRPPGIAKDGGGS